MAKQRNALKAGIFMALSVVLILGVMVAIRGLRALTEPSHVRAVAFSLTDDIGGLRAGDDVRIGGYRVGTVKSVALSEGDTPRILVTFSIPKRYALRQDAVVRIQTTFTGTSVLNFESLGTGAALGDGAVLGGLPSNMSQIVADFGSVGVEVRKTVAQVRAETLPRIDQTVAKFGQTADAGTQMMEQVRDVFGESKTDLKGTMANLNQATGKLNAKLPEILEKTSGFLTRVDGAVAQAHEALEDVRATAADMKEIGAGAKSLIIGNRGKLESMIASLKTTGDNLKGASSEIRRSPWRLLYKPSADEAKNLNFIDAARQYAEGATQLNDAAQALRDAVNARKASGAATAPADDRIAILEKELDAKMNKFKEMEAALWDNIKE